MIKVVLMKINKKSNNQVSECLLCEANKVSETKGLTEHV